MKRGTTASHNHFLACLEYLPVYELPTLITHLFIAFHNNVFLQGYIFILYTYFIATIVSSFLAILC